MKFPSTPWFHGDRLMADHPIRITLGAAALWFLLGLLVSGGDLTAGAEGGGGFGMFVLFVCWVTRRRLRSSGDDHE